MRQVLLDKTRTQMDVHLDKWAIPDGFEAVNFAGLDDEDVAGAAFKRLPVHGPLSAAFADKLDFIVRMAVRPRAFPRQSAQQKDRNVHVAVIGADKFVRAAHKRQVFLTDAVHSYPPRVRALLGARQEKRERALLGARQEKRVQALLGARQEKSARSLRGASDYKLDAWPLP